MEPSPSGGVTLAVTTSCSTTNVLEQFQYTTTWNLAIQLGGVQYCVQDPEDGTTASASPVSITTQLHGYRCRAMGDQRRRGHRRCCNQSFARGPAERLLLGQPPVLDPSGTSDPEATVGNCDSGFDNMSTWQMSLGRGGGSFAARDRPMCLASQISSSTSRNSATAWTSPTRTPLAVLIDYMCKQFPDTTDYPVWNQRWCFDQLSTNSEQPSRGGSVYTARPDELFQPVIAILSRFSTSNTWTAAQHGMGHSSVMHPRLVTAKSNEPPLD